MKVHEFARSEIVARLNHVVHHQQLAAGIHSLSAGFQNLDAPIIRPVVNDVFHDVRIGARGHRSKHIPARHRAAFHQRLQRPVLRARHHMRHIVDRAFQVRILRQDRRQQQSVPATHVHDGSYFTERIGVGHGWTVNRGQIAHALMEELPFLGMLLEELKDGHAINFIESLLSSAHAIIEMGPAESVPISAVHHRECSQTWIRVPP